MPKKLESSITHLDDLPEEECNHIPLNCIWPITSHDTNLTVIITYLKWTFNFEFCVRVRAYQLGAPNISRQLDLDDHLPLLRSLTDALHIYEAFPEPQSKQAREAHGPELQQLKIDFVTRKKKTEEKLKKAFRLKLLEFGKIRTKKARPNMFNFHLVLAGHYKVTDTGRATKCRRKLETPSLQTQSTKKDIPRSWVLTGKQFDDCGRKQIHF